MDPAPDPSGGDVSLRPSPLLKHFLAVGEEEQERRFRKRIDDPVSQWKQSPMDIESYRRWWNYMGVYDEVIAATDTDTDHAPWWSVPSDNNQNRLRRARRLPGRRIALEDGRGNAGGTCAWQRRFTACPPRVVG